MDYQHDPSQTVSIYQRRGRVRTLPPYSQHHLRRPKCIQYGRNLTVKQQQKKRSHDDLFDSLNDQYLSDEKDDDNGLSSNNSVVLEQRIETDTTDSRQYSSLLEDSPSVSRLIHPYRVSSSAGMIRSQSSHKSTYSMTRHLDTLLHPSTLSKKSNFKTKIMYECRRIFFGLTYLLVPGTFGHGQKAAAASVMATLTALALWIAVLLTALGSISIFIRVGRVNNLLTVVSINRHLEGPSLVFCSPIINNNMIGENKWIHHYQNKTVRIRWNRGSDISIVHTRTRKCFRPSLNDCGCVYLWKLSFWLPLSSFRAILLKPQLPLLYARDPMDHLPIEDSISVLIDLEPDTIESQINNPEDMSGTVFTNHAEQHHRHHYSSDKTVRVGLFTSIAVKHQDAPSWMPVEIGKKVASFLSVERFWDINVGKVGFISPMLFLHERRIFRFEAVSLETNQFQKKNKKLSSLYQLPPERLPVWAVNNVSHRNSTSYSNLFSSQNVAPPILNQLLRHLLHQKKQRFTETVTDSHDIIDVMYPEDYNFNWDSEYLTEMHFEFRSFFTTESFRVGQRMKLIGVWGVIISILACLNYLDLFYAVFPRYRGRHPRLAVSKFVRVATCGAARDNHSSKQIPIPGA